MTQGYGNTAGPIYSFGKLTVATAGTPIGLSSTAGLGGAAVVAGNVSSQTGFGTPPGGIPGLTLAGLPAQMVCNGLIISTLANTGFLYLLFAGSVASPGSKAVPNSIIVAVPPSTVVQLQFQNLSSPIMPGMLALDADTSGSAAFVSALIA